MIRLASGWDAKAIMDINNEITLSEATTKFFISSPEEVSCNLNEEKEKIEKNLAKNNLYAVYEADGKVVGYLVFKRYEYARLSHAGSMGMGIAEGYRNRGIGTRLISFLIDWARQQDGLEKICLGVVSANERAIKVYRRMGFVEEGRQRSQIKYEDGSYSNDIMMAYMLH
ncbi:GNAT family N-acetyltransferase [Planomicrobium sp. CPCC 101110]|uniref:GNAT family N-acetyltransferase n=1 Tax=Planomicrobium sp. CPCC 101110 TaxID=2599619 RepID=UPI0011B3A0A2|nr:GNAT family N-acetyltransferase [Planomicrobium sp. CPCC 101110]TWT25334.1 GNAT family N-acetyltransferase [Planomicrobium sp. CPCC 101110]